eukprot:gene26104-29488_t
MDYIKSKTRKKAKKSKSTYKCEHKGRTQLAACESFASLILGDRSSPLPVAFNPQLLAVKTHSEQGLDLGRIRMLSSECTTCSSSSSGGTDPADLLWVKVALGKSIRDLAEANYQLSSALTGEEQSQENNISELFVKVEQLLASQNDYLHEISKL